MYLTNSTLHRICLGRYVANDTLFIYTATLLWAFTMHAENPPSPDQQDSQKWKVYCMRRQMCLRVNKFVCVSDFTYLQHLWAGGRAIHDNENECSGPGLILKRR
ncbi:hypothetical protein CPB85DRAFT_697174 [Mucidula mucida]|nr:hypothetical protein CPB85DRAFT_697174 [Mucidula mucida]